MKLLSITTLAAAAATASSIPRAPAAAQSGCSASRACSQTSSSGQVSNITLTSGQRQRSFLLWIPPSYQPNKQTAAILSYHGGNDNATDQLQLDKLTDPEFNVESVVAYPQGINDFWQGDPGVEGIDDIQFTADIIDYLQGKYCIDPARIFATGKSDGAGFCNTLACDAKLSTRIAAFAPVSGAFYIDTSPCVPDTVHIPCDAGRKKVPFLEFHGGNDTTIHYQGGVRKDECLPAIPHFIQQWALRDGLGLENVTEPVAANAVLYRFGTGADAGLVEHVYDSVIGHDWPSTAPNADNSKSGHHVASFNATPIILDFFKKHPLEAAGSREAI